MFLRVVQNDSEIGFTSTPSLPHQRSSQLKASETSSLASETQEHGHAPTPWHIFDNDAVYPGIEAADDTSVVVYGRDGDEAGVRGDPATAKASAAFIVRAVNNHADLAGCLANLVELCESVFAKPKECDDLIAAKAALAAFNT